MTLNLPKNENARLEALRDYDVLDTPAEDSYDDITRLAAAICGTPMAAVSLVDRDRQWFKSRVGLDAEQTGRDEAFCAHAIRDTELFVVPDACKDSRFADNPLVTGDPNIRFYAGAPLVTPGGDVLGTLCVIDRSTRELSEQQALALRALSRQVMAQLELRRHVAEQERSRALLEDANRALQEESLRDDVSGFHNTRFLHGYLKQALKKRKAKDPLSLIFFDMDRFKQVVDTHGHPLGSKVLREVAEVTHRHLSPEDRIVRYGGDEYVLILPGQDREQALAKTERVRRAIAATSFLKEEGLRVQVTASFGLATCPHDATTPKDLLAAADKGLFRSKARGKNRISVAVDGSRAS
ncbi:MAG: sensor domain-containing diguanylate cyclase [Akkermansiaceae bacterium]|nr:sensor domain-containing diguanylate cyclase [Akkermansiaceae bacterium]